MTKLALIMLFAAGCTRTSARTETTKQLSVSAKQEFAFTVPDGAHKLRAWLTMPQKDPNQSVTDFKVDSPVPTRSTRSPRPTSRSTARASPTERAGPAG